MWVMALKLVPLLPPEASKTLRLGPLAVRQYRVRNGVDNEVPGTSAAADVLELIAAHPNCDASAIHFLSWNAHSLLVAAEDHMEGLARAFDDEILTFCPSTLARSAIEAAAQVWWLLDPKGGAAGRLSRCISLQLASTYELIKVGRAVGADASVLSEMETLIAEAQTFGLGVTRPSSRSPYVEGHRPPNATQLIASALGGVGGEMAYRLLSGGSHSIVHATVGRMLLERDVDIIEGHAGRGLSSLEIGSITAWTVSVYLSALYRWSNYVGWEADLVDGLRILTGVSHLIENGS